MRRDIFFSVFICTAASLCANGAPQVAGSTSEQSLGALTGIPTSVKATAGSTLELKNVRVSVEGNSFEGLEYTVRNSGSRPVIALGIVVQTFWSGSGERPIPALQSVDGWFLKHPVVAAGEDFSSKISTSIRRNDDQTLKRIEILIDYIEYSDGARAGQDSGGFRVSLNRMRAEKVAVQDEVRARLRGGSAAEELDSIVAGLLRQTNQASVRINALLEVQNALRHEGPESVMRSLRTPRNEFR